MIQTDWYVLTGGPSSGKSKTLDYLASLGYFTFPEIARVLIDLGIAKGKKVEEIRANDVKFQKKVFKIKIELEHRIKPKQVVFLDRGIPDSIPYFKEVGLDTDPVIRESKKRRYKKVFFLEPYSLKKDYARVEEEKTAKRISKLTYNAYKKLGYDPVRVPVMSTIEEKARFILSKLPEAHLKTKIKGFGLE